MNALVKVEPHAEAAITVPSGAALYRVSTDAAALCRDIVVATASNIQGRKYVQVEGWQAIALAHGCAASSGDVVRFEDGSVSATGRVIRIDTGTLIASAEGYVGADEATWFGGKNAYGKILPKRPDYAIRAMAQTRAISRACRSAFAHVVVMMNVGLSTTPAEEVPDEGFDRPPAAAPAPQTEVYSRREEINREVAAAASLAPSVAPSPAPKRTGKMWLDELAVKIAATTTEAELVELTGSPDITKALGWFKNGALGELNAMLADAMERVKALDDDAAEAEIGCPEDGTAQPPETVSTRLKDPSDLDDKIPF